MNNNNRNTIRIIVLTAGLLTGMISVFAGVGDSTKHDQPAQLTFIYPLGTQGQYSMHFVNHFSLNILGGVTGGTRDVEAGGLVNVDLGNFQGVQFAGCIPDFQPVSGFNLLT